MPGRKLKPSGKISYQGEPGANSHNACKAMYPQLEPIGHATRAALERFVSLPASGLERREKLEQLRALEAGMRIDVALVDEG